MIIAYFEIRSKADFLLCPEILKKSPDFKEKCTHGYRGTE